jgi:hypothetical protein
MVANTKSHDYFRWAFRAKKWRDPIIMGLVLLISVFSCNAEPLRILMIGNSYTDQTWNRLNGFLLADAEYESIIQRETGTGLLLEQHLDRESTIEALQREGPWDVVVLQEQSQVPAYAAFSQYWWEKFYSSALELSELARAGGAKVLLFQTWAREEGDTSTLPVFGNDPALMQSALTWSYSAAAINLGADVARVGEAWMAALDADPGLDLYQADNSHPSARGAYLTGAVLYEAITGKPSENLSYLGGLSQAEAAFLRGIAETVRKPSAVSTTIEIY